MSKWKTVKAPKMLYLPVTRGKGGFDDSGLRVEPSDTIEFLVGSNKIKVNGTPYDLLRSTDSIPLSPDGSTIQLQAARPPVADLRSGQGAIVGRVGEAQLTKRWDRDAAEEWQGDEATARHPSQHRTAGTDLFGRPDSARGFKIVRDDLPPPPPTSRPERPHDPWADDRKPPPRQWSADEQNVIDEFMDEFQTGMGGPDAEHLEMRPITLRDGSTAEALFDKRTNKQVGTPQRMYQAAFDPEGQQLGAATSSFGSQKARQRANDEYQAALIAQRQHSTTAPTGHDQPVQPAQRTTPTNIEDPALHNPIDTIKTSTQGASTGAPHVDQALQHRTGTTGIPLGTTAYLAGDASQTLLKAMKPTKTVSSPEALVGAALMAPDGSIVALTIDTPTPSTEMRLALAEAIPVLNSQKLKCAVVICTPAWNDDTPALLKHLPLTLIANNAPQQGFVTVWMPSIDTEVTFPAPAPA